MKDLFDSLVRTVVPIIVGAVLGWFATLNIAVDPDFEPALIVFLTLVFQAIYYAVARLLETYVTPRFGWLLGVAKQPEYAGTVVDSVDESTYHLRYPDAPVDSE